MMELNVVKNLIYTNQQSTKAENTPLSNTQTTERDTSKSSSVGHLRDDTLEKLAQMLSELVDQKEIEFHYDKKAGTLVVKIVDPRSGEIVRSIPPEYLLDMARIDKLELNGIIINKKI
ncbi:flagellar protein FlaG [Dissulfuribacter thermophilus]|nr:flagellar protein FlaG [Dissulfuribacter thermophilus]